MTNRRSARRAFRPFPADLIRILRRLATKQATRQGGAVELMIYTVVVAGGSVGSITIP